MLKNIEKQDKTKYDTFYLYLKAVTIIIKGDFDDNVFKSIYTTLVSNIQIFLGKGSG